MGLIQELEAEAIAAFSESKSIPDFRPGDTVKVHVRVVEGNRERTQFFQGVVIRRQGGGLQESFTVRKVSFGVGVERTFPLHSPSIAKLELESRGRVRRAKLYYLRERTGKKARIRERRDEAAEAAEAARLAALEQAAEAGTPDEASTDGAEGSGDAAAVEAAAAADPGSDDEPEAGSGSEAEGAAQQA